MSSDDSDDNSVNPYQSPPPTSGDVPPSEVPRIEQPGEVVEPIDTHAAEHAHLPPLMRDWAFWGMNITQFLGAFNDNLFKQMILLIGAGMAARAAEKNAIAEEAISRDLQGVATIVFSLPFILFSGLAGYLSDRYRKRPIIVASKVAEIVIMGLGLVAFALYDHLGYTGLMAVLFLMGMQSAFFGPGKYGILPEMLRAKDLPWANGTMLMFTFFAIIFGTYTGGALKDAAEAAGGGGIQSVSLAVIACVLIAALGTGTSLLIRSTPAAMPGMPLKPDALFIPMPMWRLMGRDRTLTIALLASSLFWMVGGIIIQVVNALGKTQFQRSDQETSLLAAITSVGIAVGAVIAGKLSGGKVDFRIVRWGAWGIVAGLLLLSCPGPGADRHLLGYYGSLPLLVALGIFAGMYAIPLQVFIQTRPPDDLKGRMIATLNIINFIAIMLSGVVYTTFTQLVAALGWPPASMAAYTALLILPVLYVYRHKAGPEG